MSRLAEDLVLLLLDDESGRSTVDLGRRYRAVGSAVLLDLVRAGRISIPASGDAREARVVVSDGTPTGDAALDTALAKLGEKPTKVGWAAENLGHDCWKPLLELLTADGAIRVEENRVLGLVKTRSFPTADGSREREIRAGIDAALNGARPDEETAVLITILHGIGAVPGARDDVTRERAAEIARTAWASGPLRDAFHGLDTAQLLILFAAS
ncbi:GOLPH3/VPS74 family protein [Micromonospora parva]|uniref:GOLPH3/VPS74 family protein n=1 Tax=Micromonospora parva TaxID=1464048 RepID=UPI0033D87177